MKRLKSRIIFILMAFMFPVTSLAALVGYTDRSTFESLLPGLTTVNFDSTAAGTIIPNSGSVGGITFNYDFGPDVNMEVSTGFDTTSGPNYLGTDEAGILQDGDEFSLSFAPVNAIGMYFITADPMLDDDIELTVNSISVGLSVADLQSTLPDGSSVFFLGLIDKASAFTSASVSTIGGGFFLYNVDDIVTSVIPIPGTLWLFMSGILGLFAARKKVC